MRIGPALLFLLVFFRPVAAAAQSVAVYGSGGPTLTDVGYSLAAGGGFSPLSHFAVLGSVERSHLSSRETTDGRNVFKFRGGTLTMGSAELRVSVRRRDRVGPYGVAGFAAGISRPNVTPSFPDRVTNDVRALFFGGGLNAPVNERLAFFADARMLVGDEAGELLAVAPLRAGLAWHF